MADKQCKYINSDNGRAIASFQKNLKKKEGSLNRTHHGPNSKPGTAQGEYKDRKKGKNSNGKKGTWEEIVAKV